ncbi:hypothetical protein [Vibrio salinus]|uniref:hypothetical protein n=1 Tax=Vibrio salinus TaxID=2899784 RepID=UPI001E51053F|nr:hypothetical protein [Vibrio salinus]MCE0494903.1 hypothetical protein [Vibrio salinus]
MMIIGKLNQVLQQSADGHMAVIEVRNLEPEADTDVKSLLRFKDKVSRIDIDDDTIYELHGDYVKNDRWGRVFAVSAIKSVNLDRMRHLPAALRLVTLMGK